jgi:ribosomal RNA-processing protein 8
VADFGCGDARLAASLRAHAATVHSFDLVARSPGVVACDMTRVPLPAGAVDVAVFCLSLMGSNYPDFLREGARVLRPGGRLLIAEIRSRFVEAREAGAAAGAAQQLERERDRKQKGKKRAREEASDPAGAAAAAPAADVSKLTTDGASGVDSFVRLVETLGFKLDKRDEANTMFVRLNFTKINADKALPAVVRSGVGGSGAQAPILKACLYKKR